MKKILALILLLGIWINVNAQSDESLIQFLYKLDEIAIEENIYSLKSVLNDTIFESNDICGYPGCTKEEFFNFHFTSDTVNNDWEILRQSIQYGFVHISLDSAIVQFSNVVDVYEGPAYLREIDINSELAILEKNTEIKEKPEQESKTIVTVDSGFYSCNCCIYNQTDEDTIEDDKGNFWIKVQLENNQSGFILKQNTSQRAMKILTLGKIGNEWKIIAFYFGERC
ncbi:hypothetical protein [Flammeovirga sp. SJP92]|uniref:hypothetical protein n=1 Tax=Flammeovirga sp. SJP92 TaxID=1775430 RepID=UPI000787A979|nr:hypothetical protein [Flammeovirga sp. SJP92]KXX66502.1 hypothetical protein AVL50_31745 [Flammeovirga sp. SJP92]